MRIAIADDSRADSAHLTKELMTCFTEMGYEQEEPEVYDSGEALLAVFSAGLYDFIFLDICMNENGLSGIDTAKEIRTFIANLTCKTKVVCSHDSDVVRFDGMIPQDQQKMLQLMDDRIPKINESAARLMREMIHKATF